MSPACGGPGKISREKVLRVLRKHQVAVTEAGDTSGDTSMVTLIGLGVIEVQALSDSVHRRLVDRFAHKFNIEISEFYKAE